MDLEASSRICLAMLKLETNLLRDADTGPCQEKKPLDEFLKEILDKQGLTEVGLVFPMLTRTWCHTTPISCSERLVNYRV